MKTISVEVCGDRRVHWAVGDEKPGCLDPDHTHRRIEVHQHQDVVRLPDGTPVTAVSFVSGDPYQRDQDPDFGLYLDPAWDPPWSHDHLDWPDFGVPAQPEIVVNALEALHARATAGERVELGCLGGHGRTGTALALLAALAGIPAETGVDWVRREYCPQAVETPAQAAFVTATGLPTDTPIKD